MAVNGESGGSGRCELCGREVASLTKHHLIPRTRHKNKRTRKRFTREETRDRVAWLCVPCHDTAHATLTAKEMEREVNTVEALLAHPEIRSFVRWLRARPGTVHLRVRRTARRRRQG